MLGNTVRPVHPSSTHPNTSHPTTPHPSGPLERVLAWAGAVLATLPFAATAGLAVVGSVTDRRLLVDWLMPAELAGASFVGGLALLAAALLAGVRRVAIGAALAATALLLALTNGAATWTGIADGSQAAEGWRLGIVLTTYVGFVLAAVVLAVAGWRLVRDLRRAAP